MGSLVGESISQTEKEEENLESLFDRKRPRGNLNISFS